MASLDWAVLGWIRSRLQCGFLDFLMPRLTLLGNAGALWIFIALVLLCIKRHRRTGLMLLAGLAMGVLIGNLLLKPLAARPRPCWIDQAAPLLIACPTDFSFPSGHTLSSFIAAVILCCARRSWGWGAFSLAAGIAFSRLYLYVHFPSDVLAGIVLGITIGLLVHRVSRFLPAASRAEAR